MGIQHTLHPIEVNGKIELPPACYSLSNDEKRAICLWVKNLKFSDGYSVNLSRRVNIEERKIFGMKTHDCHVFLERLLPLAVRDFLPKKVSDALIELSNFFKELCSKVLQVNDLDNLETQIAITLCKLEEKKFHLLSLI